MGGRRNNSIYIQGDCEITILKNKFLDKHISILKVLSYFSQFNYPLTKEEIVLFLDQQISSLESSSLLAGLKNAGIIFQAGKFYSLKDDAMTYEQRVRGNMRAVPLLAKADDISRMLFRFPFVRGVYISGSLSKHYASEDADIDFFIVTKSNRLWLARTLMHVFKKLSFLIGKQHLLCMNYYIDEEALEIKEHNVYTATEIFTLIHASGNDNVSEFYKTNNWVNGFYPNYEIKKKGPANKPKDGLIKKLLESLLDNRFGNMLDNYLMRLTTARWKKKENSALKNKGGRKMGLITGKHFCKPNPDFFQETMLGSYQVTLEEAIGRYRKISAEERATALN